MTLPKDREQYLKRLAQNLKDEGCAPARVTEIIAYERKVQALELEGLTRGDAQSVVEAQTEITKED